MERASPENVCSYLPVPKGQWHDPLNSSWLALGFCHLNVKDPDIVQGICQDESKMETEEKEMRVNAGSKLAV